VPRRGHSNFTSSVPRLDFLFVQKLQKMLNRASSPHESAFGHSLPLPTRRFVVRLFDQIRTYFERN